MFCATVRGQKAALHFSGDVTPYDLGTLREHVAAFAGQRALLCLRIDAGDRSAFAQLSRQWLDKLIKAGVAVQIVGTDQSPVCAPGSRNRAVA